MSAPTTSRDGGWAALAERDGRLVAPGEEWHSELYRIASAQFARCADVLELDPDDLRTRLLEPRRALTVNFPVRMDDGSVRELHRLPRPAHADDGPDQGRLALRARASRWASARRWRCG